MNKGDGGYFAIKGFLYQFDKALIEILKNPNTNVMVEHRQDIDYKDFVFQVKHKETQNYSHHKIRKPIVQFINMFKEDQSQKFCLYCHFKDRELERWDLSPEERDEILGPERKDFPPSLKNKFTANFFIQFSDDYESQFFELIKLMKTSFSLRDQSKAFLYHSLFRSKLLDLSLKDKHDRYISKDDLDEFLNSAEKTIFYGGYSKYLGRKKYETLVKREYFTIKTVNIDNFERLFIIDCDAKIGLVDLNMIANRLSRKYFKPGKSPQPYLCFRSLQSDRLIELKINLIDQGVIFNDGTCFNGDKFRFERIIKRELENDTTKLKIIDPDNIERLLDKLKIKEVFQFYLDSLMDLDVQYKHVNIQIVETKQILRMI